MRRRIGWLHQLPPLRERPWWFMGWRRFQRRSTTGEALSQWRRNHAMTSRSRRDACGTRARTRRRWTARRRGFNSRYMLRDPCADRVATQSSFPTPPPSGFCPMSRWHGGWRRGPCSSRLPSTSPSASRFWKRPPPGVRSFFPTSPPSASFGTTSPLSSIQWTQRGSRR